MRPRDVVLVLLLGVALGSAVSFWAAGVLALHLRGGSRFELVAAGDACFLLDHQSGAVQRTAAASYELLAVGDRAYRLNRGTGAVDLLEMTGWRRVMEAAEPGDEASVTTGGLQ